jgi:hypothetical protein
MGREFVGGVIGEEFAGVEVYTDIKGCIYIAARISRQEGKRRCESAGWRFLRPSLVGVV